MLASSHVLISYTPKDAEYAEDLYQNLKQDYSLWMDSHNIGPAVDSVATTKEAMREAYAIIVIVSEKTNELTGVENEILVAHQQDRLIIPVFLTHDAGDHWFLIQDIQGINGWELSSADVVARIRDRLNKWHEQQSAVEYPIDSISKKRAEATQNNDEAGTYIFKAVDPSREAKSAVPATDNAKSKKQSHRDRRLLAIGVAILVLIFIAILVIMSNS